ncbi:MAG: cytochrome c biogenesis protein CcsA [Betaproteobacteria bacterium]|jgi:ABC-type uncharacterized transport system permease subunit
MNSILPHLLSAAIYAVLGIYFWKRYWVELAAEPASTSGHVIEHVALLIPFSLHSVVLFNALGTDGALHLGVGEAISLIIWLTVFIYGLGSLYYRLEGLQALVMPAAGVAVLLPLWLPAAHGLANTQTPIFKAHLIIAMLAYSLFTIASLHVVLMALIERRLHNGTLPLALSRMPPLLTLEKLLFRIIGAGFILLSLTIFSGIVFSEELFGKAAQFNHKTIFGFLSWLIFAALLAGRKRYGWRGRTAVRWTLMGFSTLVLAYIGSKFVLEVLLHR